MARATPKTAAKKPAARKTAKDPAKKPAVEARENLDRLRVSISFPADWHEQIEAARGDTSFNAFVLQTFAKGFGKSKLSPLRTRMGRPRKRRKDEG